MRAWIRADWTGEPPGELMLIATAAMPLRAKARSRTPFDDLKVMAGRKGEPMPMAPLSATWLTTGTDLRKRKGIKRLKKDCFAMAHK